MDDFARYVDALRRARNAHPEGFWRDLLRVLLLCAVLVALAAWGARLSLTWSFA